MPWQLWCLQCRQDADRDACIRARCIYGKPGGVLQHLQALGTDLPVTEGPAEGRFDDRFSWDMLIEPYDWNAPEGSPGTSIEPYQVTVKVFWDEASQRRSIALTALRLVTGQP